MCEEQLELGCPKTSAMGTEKPRLQKDSEWRFAGSFEELRDDMIVRILHFSEEEGFHMKQGRLAIVRNHEGVPLGKILFTFPDGSQLELESMRQFQVRRVQI